MPLTIPYLHGNTCPVIVCDVCHTRITTGTDGNYEWSDDEDTPTVYFSHKACSAQLRITHSDVDMWGPLSALPAYLRMNLKLTWREAEDSAEFMESV